MRRVPIQTARERMQRRLHTVSPDTDIEEAVHSLLENHHSREPRKRTPEVVEKRRERVQHPIVARGVRSRVVLDAMGKVRREGFVLSYLGELADDETALPIEEEQTISQPFIVAYMVEALDLEGFEHVLEIGTGSGYAASGNGAVKHLIPSPLAQQIEAHAQCFGELEEALLEGLLQPVGDALQALEAWPSDRPETLCDEMGRPIPALCELAAKGRRRMGAKPHVNGETSCSSH